MRKYNVSEIPDYIEIGRAGENDVTQIVFDFSDWQAEYGDGVVTLLLRRPDETLIYPVALTIDGNTATWTISNTDTSIEGAGTGELTYTIEDQLKKSACFVTRILCALTGDTEDPPPPYESYVEQVLAAATQVAEDAADAAQSAADAAQSAADAAQSAASVDAPELNRRILAAFPTGTAGPAAVVNVDDGADGIPIKSLSVAVEPAQSGSGTPSPDNVRPISGWNALNVNISPTQDAADGETYTFPFANTVYGGTFELTYDGTWSANMTVDRALASISDFNWSYSTQSAFFWVKLNAMQLAAPVIASAYNYVGAVTDGNMASVATGSIAVAPSTASDPYIKIKDTRYTTVANFTTAMGAETVCYELATPTEIAWSEAELLEILGTDGFCTLLGVNNVWADAGETSMTYRQDVGIVIGKLLAAI